MRRFNIAKLVLLALLLVGTTSGFTHTHELCEGFVPENDLKIPVGDRVSGMRNNGGLTEAQFNSVIDRIQTMYGEAVKAKGKNLKINRLWSDATVNASAQQMGNEWIVNMYGGLARHSDITVEGFALVACHEMGHHLGGAPKVNSFLGINVWATNEGGSDYYSTLNCLRVFFGNEDNSAFVANATVDPHAKDLCKAQFETEAEQALCMRLSLAGESVAYLFQALRKETTRPQFSTPDQTKVTKTNDAHPATQCRMDTYLAGALCKVKVGTENSDKDWKVGSCVEGVEASGFRPRCWFNPDGATAGSCPLGNEALCQAACQFKPDLPFCGSKSVHY